MCIRDRYGGFEMSGVSCVFKGVPLFPIVKEVLLAPFYTLKTVHQTQHFVTNPTNNIYPKFESSFTSWQELPHRYGNKALLSGTFPRLFSYIPQYFTSRYIEPSILQSLASYLPNTFTYNILKTLIITSINIPLSYPFQVASTLMIIDTASGTHNYNSTSDCINKMIKQEGFFSLYSGAFTYLIASILHQIVHFSLWAFLINKQLLGPVKAEHIIFYKGITCLMSSILTYPLDSISRYQMVSNQSIITSATSIYNQQGFLGFYNGICFSLLRGAVGHFIYRHTQKKKCIK
eukprot:TRINITY_DN20561_c0_g1_i1.p1 TRINITY_DN20561_c0_g1~~TRINITY_DN20561_c0_g1_i1.p1  ORF type:complete len:290 (+),score=31.33 TRINITY_DN20561_c0_g1_i1:25-894(+)